MKTALRVAIPQSELYEQLQALGWSLKKIDMKNGLFVAKGIGPAEQEADRVGQTPEGALAALLLYAQRSNAVRRFASIQKFAAWSNNFLDQVEEIALAYMRAPVFDEKAVPAWRALAAESKMQADAIRQQLKVEVTDESDPYPSAEEMCKDVHQNKHFVVSRANSQHPVWSVEDNVNFRIVHDVLGHCQSGGDFGWVGENLACGAHFPLISPLAREALFTECIAQTAYQREYHGFGPQKVVLLSQYLHPVQEQEGEHVFVPHGGLPALQQAPNMNAKGTMDQAPGEDANTGQPGAWVPTSPAMTGIHGDGSSSVMRPLVMQTKNVSDNLPVDPNKDWKPTHTVPSLTAGSPNDYLDLVGTIDNASKIDTDWFEEDEATQRRAIMNAFRVAILSPRKHLKWNAAHYQALMHTDPATSARDMWDLLENERERYNQALGHPEGSHLRYRKNLEFLADQLAQTEGLTRQESLAQAKEIVYEKTTEFEKEIGRQVGDEESEIRRYLKAREMVTAWLAENYSPMRGWQPGQMSLASAWDAETAEWAPAPVSDSTGFGSAEAKYGAFMGTHLDSLAQVGEHVDAIRTAALEDIHEGEGKGFLFRNRVMNMNLSGVNPKVCSFAWLLLRPMSSELGIIDAHMLRGLNRSERDMNVRDYYKLERMQRAAKDATGYSHLPLALYHWGLWDHIRNPGSHSDHSPLRVLDPEPWEDHPWDAATSARNVVQAHPAFESARPHMEQAALDFDSEFAGMPSGRVPYKALESEEESPRLRSPFVVPYPGMR